MKAEINSITPMDNNPKCCSWQCIHMSDEGNCNLFEEEELELAYDEPNFSCNENEFLLRAEACLKNKPIEENK